MYASLGRRLFEATDTPAAVDVVNEIKTKLRERVPVVDEVKALFPSIIYTENQTKQRNLVKYILAGFQKHSLKSVVIDFDAMTIEHLAPQSLIGKGAFSEEIVGQLGNLILVPSPLNTKLDDKPFKEKKRILEAAEVKLPPEFANLNDLTPEVIQSRTANLADKAYGQVWKI
jgi:hypothetical protein